VKVGLGTPTRPESCTTIGCSYERYVHPLFDVVLDCRGVLLLRRVGECTGQLGR
jgi:hypothetical protein